MDSSTGEQRQLELNLGEHGEGRYSNLVMITHTASEVIFDFAVMMPGMAKANIVSRIILTPEHAKRFLAALSDNLGRYENRFGPIKLPELGQSPPSSPT